MTHPDLAARIRSLVDDERFDEAEALLPEYAKAVIEECVTAADEASFASARAFLRATMIQVRARRAHLAQQFREVEQPRPYLMVATRPHDVDVTG